MVNACVVDGSCHDGVFLVWSPLLSPNCAGYDGMLSFLSLLYLSCYIQSLSDDDDDDDVPC